jgi:phosphoribosyl 1,2-cyclic phosphodiesterase
VRLWVLGSGSKGNALVVECAGHRVLVDVGFPARSLAARMMIAGIPPESIDAAVITHEHGDHICGAARGARKWGWAVHASTGTLAAERALQEADARGFESGATLELDTMRIQTTPTSHDAADSVALVVTARRTGARLGIAYDLGTVTANIARAMRDLDCLVVEMNHDEEMLRFGPYPRSVQNRIAGRRGHLSNQDGAGLARGVAHGGLRHVILAHVSENCNTPRAAQEECTRAMRGTRFQGRIDVAPQRAVLGPIDVGSKSRRATQLELGL